MLRQLLRRRFRYNSRFYRMGSQLVNVVALLMRCGLEFTITLLRLKCLPIGTEVTLSFPGITYPFLVRAGTDDVGTVINNFVRCEYGKVPCELIPATIIDAGAYIGDTSAFFLSRYPNARVIALEPSAINSAVAEKNLAPYGERVSLRRAALGAERGTVRLAGDQTAARIAEWGDVVPMVTISDLLREIPGGRVDLLKLDIEGAERLVLGEAAIEWLGCVRCIVLETHGCEAERIALGTLRDAGWGCWRYRNLWYCEPKEV